ncbi:polysaccharide biosynthesis/export family protein [Sphingomonas sp. CJ20]
MRVFLLCCLLATAGCARPSLPEPGTGAVTLVRGGVLPSPDLANSTAGERPFFIGPFDRLQVSVVAIPEIGTMDFQVDASGRISVPFVGILRVGGLTPLQIEAEIKDSLKASGYLKDPQVAVNLKEMVSQTVTVAGEVKSPGVFPVIGRLTLLRAITIAKGTTEFSKMNDVVVFREVGGERYAALYDFKAIQDGRYPDPEIFANDVIRVGDSRARRLFRDFITASPLWSGPIILLLRGL